MSADVNAAVRAPAPGEQIDVDVEKGVYRGVGLARHHGQVVFVPRGLPGDRWRVRVEGRAPGYLRSRPLQLLSAGPQRRDSPCLFFPRCGGCAYQALDYPGQLQLKTEVLRESLARSGVAWDAPIGIRPSPERGWRTRATFHLGEAGGKLCLGLHEEGTRRVVDLEACLQLSEASNRACRALLASLEHRPEWARAIRDVSLAESQDGAERVMLLEAALEPAQAQALIGLARDVPGLTGLCVRAGHAAGRRLLVLQGDPYVHAVVRGVRLRSHVWSFFQANRFLVEDLAGDVADLVTGPGPVLDLYAGVGLFTLALAGRAESVRGIESSRTAVEDAASNAAAAGLSHVRVQRGDVLGVLRGLAPVDGESVVLDPPRTGAGPEVVAAVAERRPRRVVYVSCDPPTLGRDLKAFALHGYGLTALRAHDMFPDTFHVETVGVLEAL